MTTRNEYFWQKQNYAFVGHSAAKGFPKLSYAAAKKIGKTVFAVDTSVSMIDGDPTYDDLTALPDSVDGVVIEVPPDETAGWVQKAIDAGVKDVWIHMGRETQEALKLASEAGINLHTGTCAVMYVVPGPSYHSIHKWINKAAGKF